MNKLGTFASILGFGILGYHNFIYTVLPGERVFTL